MPIFPKGVVAGAYDRAHHNTNKKEEEALNGLFFLI